MLLMMCAVAITMALSVPSVDEIGSNLDINHQSSDSQNPTDNIEVGPLGLITLLRLFMGK